MTVEETLTYYYGPKGGFWDCQDYPPQVYTPRVIITIKDTTLALKLSIALEQLSQGEKILDFQCPLLLEQAYPYLEHHPEFQFLDKFAYPYFNDPAEATLQLYKALTNDI